MMTEVKINKTLSPTFLSVKVEKSVEDIALQALSNNSFFSVQELLHSAKSYSKILEVSRSSIQILVILKAT